MKWFNSKKRTENSNQIDWLKDNEFSYKFKNIKLFKPLFWFILILTLTFAGLLFFLISLLSSPGKTSVVFIGAGYETNTNVASNYEGKRILEQISNWVGNYSSFGITQVEPLIVPTREINFKFPEIDPRSKVAIVIISMALDYDENGLFLLKNDARPNDDGKGKIRINSIIDEMRKLPEKMSKIIILDPVSIRTTLGKAGPDLLLSNEFDNEKIESIPNLNLIVANTNKEITINEEVLGLTPFWKKIITLLIGTEELQNSSKFFGIINALDSKPKKASKTLAKDINWYPIGKEGEIRANKAFLLLPKIYSSPNLSNTFFIDDYSSIVKEAWSNYAELMKQGTTPAVYAPELWREYEKICIRLETLKKQGANAESKKLIVEMKKLENKIMERKKLNLQSETNGFQYMWLEGVPIYEKLEAALIYRNLDKEKSRSIEDPFNDMKKKGTPEYIQRRIAFLLAQRMIDVAIATPSVDLENSIENVSTILDADSYYPNEIQTGHIYKPKNKKNVNNEESTDNGLKFENLIKLKLVSEKSSFGLGSNDNIHLYSEKLWPYISNTVTKADNLKSLSQDLSLSSSKNDMTSHIDLQMQAELLYKEANETANILQSSFGLRDKLASELPWITHWLILTSPTNNSNFEETPYNWEDSIKKLWDMYHKINNLIIYLPSPHISNDKKLNVEFNYNINNDTLIELNSIVTEANNIYITIKEKLNILALKTIGEESIQSWLLIKNLLNTPFFSLELRSKLLNHQSKIEKFLTDKLITYKDDDVYKEDNIETNKFKSNILNISCWLKSFGINIKRTSPELSKKLEKLTELLERLKLASDKNDITETNKLAKIQIDKCILSQEETISSITNFIQSNQSSLPQKGFPITYLSLKEVETIARTFPWLLTEGKLNDTSISLILKKAETRDFLCWQAFRTWQDHLYSVEENKEPYYLTLINQILLDVNKMQGPTDITEISNKLLDNTSLNIIKLKKDPELISGYNGEIPWTFEKKRDIEIGFITSNENLQLNGKIAVGVKVSDSLKNVDKLWDMLNPKLIDIQNQENKSSTITLNLERKILLSNKTDIENAFAKFQCFFRGKFFSLEIPIEIRNLANIVNQEMVPDNSANIAFRSNANLSQIANGLGSITFVLDCSGSMGPLDNTPIEDSKYFQAVLALEKVLTKIQKGVTISVWIFGQAVGPGKTVLEPEKNIIQIIEPISWDPENSETIKTLLSKLKYPSVEPWNASPIIHAMSMALKDIVKYEGAKMMVVLTDGLDNRIKKDKKLNPNSKNASSILFSLFNEKNVQVQIIGFRANPEEETEMKSQFSFIEQIDPPGNFVNLNSLDEVVDKINRFITPSAFIKIDDLNNFNAKELNNKTVEISKRGTGDHWLPNGIIPGFYNVKLKEYPATNKEIKLENNDRLLVGIEKSNSYSPFEFKRLLISETDYIEKPSIEKQNWRSAVLSNKLFDKNCKLFTVLEKKYNSKEVLFSQIKPKQVWWELKHNNKNLEPLSFKISKFHDFPAQAWTIESLNWPKNQVNNISLTPIISLWWNSDQETSFLSRIDKDIDYKNWNDLERKKIQLDGKSVLISSCNQQNCYLKNKNGIIESQNALVISIIHPLNMQLSIKFEELKNVNVETHWFKNSGQTVCVLWPTAKDTIPLPTGIIFSSVDRIKKDAESRGMFLEFSNLTSPDPDAIFPGPVLSYP